MSNELRSTDIKQLPIHRRIRVLKLFTLASLSGHIILLAVNAILLISGQPVDWLGIGFLSFLAVGSIGVWLLAHAKRVDLGTHIFFFLGLVTVLLISLPVGIYNLAIPLLFGVIVSSTLLLQARWTFIYATISLVTCLLIAFISPRITPELAYTSQFIGAVIYGVYFYIIALPISRPVN